MAPNALTQLKNDHHVILGVALILIGGFGVIGSFTGRLAPMIGGIFDPGDLVSAAGSGSGNGPDYGATGGATISGLTGTNIANSASSGITGSSVGSGLYNIFKDLLP